MYVDVNPFWYVFFYWTMPHSKSIHSQPNHTAGARKRLKHNRKVWGAQLATSKRAKHWCGQCFPPIKQAFWLKLCYVEPLIGCQGFHTKMNIPSPLPTSLVFRSFCRLLICLATFPATFQSFSQQICFLFVILPCGCRRSRCKCSGERSRALLDLRATSNFGVRGRATIANSLT